MNQAAASGGSIYRSVVLSMLLAIGSAVGALFLIMDYWVDREVHSQLDRVLHERGRTLERMLRLSRFQDSDGHRHDADLATEFFSLYSSAGALLGQSTRNEGRPLPLPDGGVVQPRYYDLRLPDGHDGRAVALPVRLPDGRGSDQAVLVIANDREGWDKTETRIHSTLLLATVAISVLASLMAIGLIRHAFAFLRRTAVQLSRLDVDQPPRPIGAQFPLELKPFAEAFNTGVQRLYLAIDRERRFSSNVAHELRTPLAEIRSSAESALASEHPGLSRQALLETVEGTLRMQRSVDALLQLARLESGQDTPLSDPLDLPALLRAAVRASLRSAGGNGRGVVVDAGAPAWVCADPAILERILANLLSNAIEYASGDGDVRCSIQRHADGTWVAIANPADGLRDADLRHFGQRFWRRQPEGGTAHHAGLGLALSLGLAQAHSLQLLFQVRDGWLQARLGPLAPV